MIDAGKIIRLHQPLCMVEMIKENDAVRPLDGGYFGVPYLVGWRDSEPSIRYADWMAVGSGIQTNWGTRDSGDGMGDGSPYAYWNEIGTASGGLGKDFMSHFPNSPIMQYQAVLISSISVPAHDVTYNGGTMHYTAGEFNQTVHQLLMRLIFENVPNYIYLAKASDGMPYHFATEANAQKWIDKTLEREAKTKPKQGADREKKIASLSAYREKINKQWKAAKLRAYQNADLKTKVLDMLVREYTEAGDRLSKI